MIHRLIVAGFGILALASCQTPKITEQSDSSVKSEVSVNPNVSANPAVSPIKPKVATSNKDGEPKSAPLSPKKGALESAKKEEQNSTLNKTAGVIYFKEGENKFLKEFEMNVTFKKISEDSRCPKDVNCIWAGVATADVEFMGLYTRPVILKLSTLSDAKKGYYKSQSFNGSTISLVELTPQPTSSKGFKALQGSYRIGLKITKGNAVETTPRTGTTTK